MTDLVSRIRSTAPAELLPARRAEEAARVQLPLEVLEDVPLGSTAAGDLHHLLLADARGERFGVPAVVTPERVRRAVPGDGASSVLVAQALGRPGPHEEEPVPVDQTNELVVVDGSWIVKWYLHPSRGDVTALERLDRLAANGFTGTPAVVGRRLAEDGSLLAVISEYVPGARDGWEWLVEVVREHARGADVDALAPVRAVGSLVADLHAAFAADGVSPATPDQAAAWLRGALADADAACLPSAVDDEVRDRLQPIGECEGTPVMAIHGDLHVGQILRSSGPSYLVIDFDGNPLLPPRERFAPGPPARDVAGMLASLDHVGRVVIHRTADLAEDGQQRVLAWIDRAQAEFVASYEARLAELGVTDLLDRALLLPFQVQQECREYSYAARYLPHWTYVPDAALPALLTKDRP